MSVAFLLCVEPGPLEAKAVLLCRSIRRWAGRFADAPIVAIQPRPQRLIAAPVQDELVSLGVTVVAEPVNTRCPDYPIANKVFAGDWASRTRDEETLVFLDTDTVLLGSPDAFELAPGIDAAARPVDRKRFGSCGPGDEHEPYWRELYDLCGLGGDPRVETTVDGESIRAYFNAGLVVARRTSGVWSRWREHFVRLLDVDHRPAGGAIEFLDQFALAVTLGERFDRVSILPWTYNYPLPLRRLLPPPMAAASMSTLVHVHYHQWFNRPDGLRLVDPALDPGDERVRWLDEHVPLDPVHETPAPLPT